MTTGRYIIRRVKIGARLAVLLCTAHVSNADIQVGFEAAKCVNPLPAYTGRRLTVNGENRPKHRPFYRRKQLANRQAFPLNSHTIPVSALVTSMAYTPSARVTVKSRVPVRVREPSPFSTQVPLSVSIPGFSAL